MLTEKQMLNKHLKLILFLFAIVLSLFFYEIANSNTDQYVEQIDLVGDYNVYQRKWIHYAWDISNDKEFIYMLKAENGLLNHDRRHDPSYNQVGVDWGFCGINDFYHRDIVRDERFINDVAWQMDQCYRLYTGGTKFYAIDRIKHDSAFKSNIASNFIFF